MLKSYLIAAAGTAALLACSPNARTGLADNLAGQDLRPIALPASLNISTPLANGEIDLSSPKDAAAIFLRERAIADNLVVTRDHRSKSGRTFRRYEQVVDGRKVYGSLVMATFDPEEELVQLKARTVLTEGVRVLGASVDASTALRVALADIHPGAPMPAVADTLGVKTTFEKGEFFYAAPEVEEIVLSGADGSLSVGYAVTTWSASPHQLDRTIMSGTGDVIHVERRTQSNTYRAYDPHPFGSGRLDRTGPGNDASPSGRVGSISPAREGTTRTHDGEGNKPLAITIAEP